MARAWLDGGLGRDYHRVWAAMTVSNLGDGMVELAALPLLASAVTHDPSAVAGVVLAARLPWLLVGLFSGALVDRFDRRRLMILSDLGRALLLAGLAAAVALGSAPLAVVYGVAFLLGVGSTVFDNGAFGIVPAMVPADRLPLATGRIVASYRVNNNVVGPALGGWTFALAPMVPFAADSVSFVLSAVLLRPIRSGRHVGSLEPFSPGRLLVDVAQGIAWVWRHRLLLGLAVAVGLLSLLYTSTFSIFVLFALEDLGVRGSGYGLVLASGAIGGLLGSLVAPRLSGRLGTRSCLASSVLISGLAYLALSATSSPVLAAAMLAVNGLGVSLWDVVTLALRQSAVPQRLFGRVNAVYRLFAWGAMPLGAAVGGLLAGAAGLRAPFLVAGTANLVISVALLLVVSRRRLESTVRQAEPGPA
jgi:MFS family permease